MQKSLLILLAVASTALVNGSLLVDRATLERRQSLVPSDIPEQCNPFCSPYYAQVQACGSANAACLCTSAVENNGVNCANCVVSVYPSQLTALQAESDAAVELCTQHGTPITPVKLTGVMPTTTGGALPTGKKSGGVRRSGDGAHLSVVFALGLVVAGAGALGML